MASVETPVMETVAASRELLDTETTADALDGLSGDTDIFFVLVSAYLVRGVKQSRTLTQRCWCKVID